jgi:hypothetical protein
LTADELVVSDEGAERHHAAGQAHDGGGQGRTQLAQSMNYNGACSPGSKQSMNYNEQ